jgi:hypothetical protein
MWRIIFSRKAILMKLALVCTTGAALLIAFASGAQASSQKICSPIEPDKWRTIAPVPKEWVSGDCRSFSESVGATSYKLGCIFSETVGEKYSWSVEVKQVTDEAAPPPPPPPRNCGW